MGGAASTTSDVGSSDFEADLSDDESGYSDDGFGDHAGLSDEVSDEASSYVGANSGSDGDDDDDRLETSDDEEEAREIPQKGRRAEKRIQGLSRELKESRMRSQQYESQLGGYQQQMHQIQLESQKQIAEMREQFASSNKELEIMRQQSSLREEEGLDDVEKFRRQLLRDAESSVGKKYEPKLEAANRRYEELVNKLENQEREGRIQQRITGYDQDADTSVHKLLDSLPANVRERQFDDIKTHVLNYSAYTGMEPSEGAREFDRIARTYVLSLMKSRGQKNGETMRKGQAIPRGTPTQRRPAKGSGRITSQQARASGFSNSLEAMIDADTRGRG